ncbi:redox-regulated ATPase YchF [Candidatus Peribacteria bacterium RIFCSPLOWO2_01_FULL_51_18]|nr:MAG: redox-regulated ATPase YchF [Candidatus Peribacteria bacterium RIFCSPHIGHO2_02_FULL_51_15]OGJ66017.1 MAG: redox-regulated ATPase YchF [Candidatus Peribacteria bacterium RIFCSPLOWO2_01_FULL_51_18]
MSLKIGIVGLPNVGKSTLFNALTRSRGAAAANYPFCTIDPNIGVVEVPDERLKKLAGIVNPEKIVPAIVEFVDIAGLVKGASKGEGLGNAFLSHIREVDAICHVVRVFEGTDVIHVEGSVNPKRDLGTIEAELCIADLDKAEKKIEKIQGGARTGNKELMKELNVMEKLKAALSQGKPAITVPLDKDEAPYLRAMQLLTAKRMIYALNTDEQALASLPLPEAKKKVGLSESDTAIIVSAKLEEELIELTPEDGKAMLKELGVRFSGLDKLIQAAYDALGLLTFFTAGPKEAKAWTVRKGATAPEAAGVIHTDFEKGFIRAETISYADFIAGGGELKAKEQGKLRIEGKEYAVQDGDVMHFRFNV